VIDLESWRKSISPPESAWWWFLDQSFDIKQGNVIRNILTGTLMLFVLSLTVEVIRRLWENSSDTLSVVVTLFTLLLTTSPFVKQGQGISEWFLVHLPFKNSKNISDLRLTMAALALLTLLILRLWILPGPLATYYNNSAVKARNGGNSNLAQHLFKRAAALNPERVVPYQNVADLYKEMGMDKQAIEWYQKIIERDANFSPAYRGIGGLYNKNGDYLQAETILLAGLSLQPGHIDETIEIVTRYELLSNLGWSYWGQAKIDMARATLENSLSLEADIKKIGDSQKKEFRFALPHYYLAQIYEQLGEKKLAIEQWEETLRFLDQADWHQREQYQTTQQHLQALTK
jgi:tetratricopeptide (TPR) repeat protein